MAKAKKENNTPATTNPDNKALVGYEESGAWGSEDIGSEDLLIPRIMLMQAMSDLVTDGKAAIGEFRDSLNKDRIVGSKDKPFECIVFGSEKKIMKFVNKDFSAMEDFTPGYVYEESDENQNIIQRSLLMQFFCLLVEDVEKGEAFPYVLSFRSTSIKSGKTLATMLKKLQVFKKPSAARVFKIGATQESNDKGKWFVPSIEMGRDSTPEEMKDAYQWYKMLKEGKTAKVDDGDLVSKDETTETPAPTSSKTEEPTVTV